MGYGEELKRLRIEKGLKFKDLDHIATRQTIANIEAERTIPSNATLSAYLEAVGTSLQERPNIKKMILAARVNKNPVVKESLELLTGGEAGEDSPVVRLTVDQFTEALVGWALQAHPEDSEHVEAISSWARNHATRLIARRKVNE